MSFYVLNTPRLDRSAAPANVRWQGVLVWGSAGTLESSPAIAERVLDMVDGKQEDLGAWSVSERLGLYEEMRRAERDFAMRFRGLGLSAGPVAVTGRFA